MTRESELIKLIRTYGQQSGSSGAAAADVDIGAVTTAVRSALTGQFLPRSEYDTHRLNRNAHHPEVHDILASHTASGVPYTVVGLDADGRLDLLGSVSDARRTQDTLLRSNFDGGLGVNYLDTDGLLGQTGNINLLSSLKSENYASETTGFRIVPGTGEGDFRYLYSDEMHVKVFYADLVRALAGIDIVAKSVGELYSNFYAPAPGASTNILVKDHKAMPGVGLFSDGDLVALQQFSRVGGELVVALCWGTVSNYASSIPGVQRWTFTRSLSPNAGSMAAGANVQPGAVVLDYGKTGNGYIEQNAIDGPNSINAPYTQVVQWTGHPQTGKVVRTRLGNLRGLGFTGKYGLYVRGVDADQYILATGDGITHQNTTDQTYNGALKTYQRDPNGTLRVGANIDSTATTTLALFGVAQTYASETYGDGDLLIGNPGAANMHWDRSAGRINFRQAQIIRAYIDTDGSLRAGSGNWLVDVDGQNMQQDAPVSSDSARAIKWWASISSRGGDPTQSISAFYNTLNQNILLMEARAQGSIFESITQLSARPWSGSTVNWSVYSSGMASLALGSSQRQQMRALATSNDLYLLPANLGNNVRGSGVYIGRNTNAGAAGPAPGWLALMSPNGTWHYFWADDSGNLRKATSDPTGSTGSATRNGNSYGTIV